MIFRLFLLSLACLSQCDAQDGDGGAQEPSASPDTPLTLAASTTRSSKKCQKVRCDPAVLQECDSPVIFAGGECCPVCPIADVCTDVECGENEVCSEQDGQAVCCTEVRAKQRLNQLIKKVLKRSRTEPASSPTATATEGSSAVGEEATASSSPPSSESERTNKGRGRRLCSTRKAGVSRGPCTEATCSGEQVCVALLKEAYCCPPLPPCQERQRANVTVLARCHEPGSEAPTRPSKPSSGEGRNCSCIRPRGDGRRRGNGRQGRREGEGGREAEGSTKERPTRPSGHPGHPRRKLNRRPARCSPLCLRCGLRCVRRKECRSCKRQLLQQRRDRKGRRSGGAPGRNPGRRHAGQHERDRCDCRRQKQKAGTAKLAQREKTEKRMQNLVRQGCIKA